MLPFKKIIIIDDDKTVNLICSYIIKKHLPDVLFEAFTNPEEALKSIKQGIHNAAVTTVILLDINMPTLTGWEVLEHLRKMLPNFNEHFSVYMFSSSIYYRDREQSQANPLVTDFIDKPLTIDKLDRIIDAENSKRTAPTIAT